MLEQFTFIKKSKFVSFHQDLKYWKFLNDKCLTVSLALTKVQKKTDV